MDMKKIGKFIAELRKEKKITQDQLAFEIMTSRENVSKWERGVNTPTAESLLLLSKYFKVSVNEILMGERKTEENEEQVDNMSVEVMKVGEKKVKTVLKNFIILISFIIVAFLVYYFINTYNTIRVYKIGGIGDNFNIREGLAIFSKGKSYLRIGEIESDSNIEYDGFEIFYKDKNEEKQIFISDDSNYTLLSDFGYNEAFSYKNLKYLEDNTYIRIKYQDKEEVIKLNFKRDMVNNFLVPNSETDVTDDSKFKNNSKDMVQKLESYARKNWKYNEEKNEYTYNGNNNGVKYEISYHLADDWIAITEYKNKEKRIIEINMADNNVLTYLEEMNGKLSEIYKYDFSNKKCLSGKCDDKITNYYLENYYYKYIK